MIVATIRVLVLTIVLNYYILIRQKEAFTMSSVPSVYHFPRATSILWDRSPIGQITSFQYQDALCNLVLTSRDVFDLLHNMNIAVGRKLDISSCVIRCNYLSDAYLNVIKSSPFYSRMKYALVLHPTQSASIDNNITIPVHATNPQMDIDDAFKSSLT